MRRDESAIGLGRDVIKSLFRDDATMPDQIRCSAGLLQLEHLDGFAAAMVHHKHLNRTVAALQQRNSMRPKRIADRAGTCGIAPILAGIRSGRHPRKCLLREIE